MRIHRQHVFLAAVALSSAAAATIISDEKVPSRSLISSAFGNSSHIVDGKEGRFLVKASDSFVGWYMTELGEWDLPFQKLVARVMLARSAADDVDDDDAPPLWLDIGANVGIWSIFMARAVAPRGGSVISFEPQLDLNYAHGASLLLNDIDNNRLVHAFVGNDSGYTTIAHPVHNASAPTNYGAMSRQHLSDLASLDAHLSSPSHTPSPSSPTPSLAPSHCHRHRHRYAVQNLRLDDCLASGLVPQCPAFIKLDIEMHELQALIGGLRLLRDCRPVLFLEAECVPLLRSLVRLLDSLGYILAWVVLPVVELGTSHRGRHVEHSFENMQHVYISRNLLAVPRSDEALLRAVRAEECLAAIDVAAESAADPETWFALQERSVRLCHDQSGQCFMWGHAGLSDMQRHPVGEGPSSAVQYKCGNVDIPADQVFYYKKLESQTP